MNRRLMSMPAAILSAAFLVAACNGGTATTVPTGAAAVPTAAPGSTAAAGPTAAVPTPLATLAGPLDTSQPSFLADNGLAAKFPTVIDGQPVTGVQTAVFEDVMRQSGAADADIQALSQKLSAVGIDFSKLSFGSATATVDGAAVQLEALRTPDSDANKIIQNYAYIVAAFGTTPEALPTMAQSTIGGKNVTVSTDSDGKVTVLYVSGDTLFILQDMTDSQTTKIAQTLP